MPNSAHSQLEEVIYHLRRSIERALRDRKLAGAKVVPAACEETGSFFYWYPAPGLDPRPVIVNIHGGGFALGDARKSDAMNCWMRDTHDVSVAAVEYRKTPLNAYPAAQDDVCAVIKHLVAHAKDYNIDPSRIYLMGFSAGACLALSAALMLEGDLRINIAGLLLHYPFVDAATDPGSLKTTSEELPVDMQRAFNAWYVGDADPKDPFVSPLFASDSQFAALPKTVICVAEGDVLEASAEQLSECMRNADCDVVYRCVRGVFHGYIEEAADIPTLIETSMPAALAAKGTDFVQTAARMMELTLQDLLGEPVSPAPFPLNGIEELRRIAASS